MPISDHFNNSVYLHCAADFTKTAPVKYALCSADPNYVTKGMGGLNFNFTNLRADISFHYFTAQTAPGGKTYPGFFTPVLVATSPNNVTFSHINEALKPRIVAVGESDSIGRAHSYKNHHIDDELSEVAVTMPVWHHLHDYFYSLILSISR